jgi:YVTN family beta-propeller protein
MGRRSAIGALASAAVLAASGCAPSGSALPVVPNIVATTEAPPLAGPDVYAATHTAVLSTAVDGVPSRVYVPNTVSDTVDVIDPITYEVVDHFVVGREPQHVTPSWDLKTLYVDNDKSHSLTPIDPTTGRRGPDIPVDDPYNLYFTPDGTRAVVVAEALRRLDFRDPHSWQLIKSVRIPFDGVDHADFSADGRRMVLSCEFSGMLVEVDVARMEMTRSLKVGGAPIDVKLSPDGSVYYVANQSRDGVSIIDAVSFVERSFVKTGRGAHGLYPSRDGRHLYVTNRKAGSVTVLDFKRASVVATWDVGGSPDMGGVSIDGRELWLSGRYHGEVYVVSTTTGRVLHRIKVGNGPHGLAVFPQPGRYSLGHTGIFR